MVRKRRADEVDAAGGAAEVDGEAGLVFAAAGQGDVAAGEALAVPGEGIVPDALLFAVASPARDGDDFRFAAAGLNAGAKQRGGRAVEQDVPVAGEGRERRAEAIGQRVRGVDEDQRAAVNGRAGKGDGIHEATS